MTGVANEDVKQYVHVVASEAEKQRWLSTNLPVFIDEGTACSTIIHYRNTDHVHDARLAVHLQADTTGA